MKFYKYKQLQRMAFFGFDDLNRADASSLSKKSPQSTTTTVINDTKTLKFNLNKLFQTPLSKNAKIVSDAANLGYCQLFHFKCAGARTCDAWLFGGPVT